MNSAAEQRFSSNRRTLIRLTLAAVAVIALIALYGYLTGALGDQVILSLKLLYLSQ